MAPYINPFYKGQAQARQAAMGRKAVSAERLALMKAVNRIPPLRVAPAPGSEHLRGTLKHPNGVRLRREGSVEWPNDRFTNRRIEEGVIVEVKNDEAAKPAAGRRTQPAE